MSVGFREARDGDAGALLALLGEFNASQGYPFDARSARRTLAELLASPSLGRVWLIDADGSAEGYLVLTFGFSLEHGGRDAFVDELYVRPRARGRGLGRAALSFALGEAARLGVHAVHLEVERTNAGARTLYEAVGFRGNDRALLTCRIAGRKDPAGE